MARLRVIAEQLKGVAEDSIGWIVIWKEGKSWNGTAVWPDYIEESCSLILSDEDRELIREIVTEDPQAVLLNSWVHNLGVNDYEVSTIKLEQNLRWQYREGTYMAKDAL